MLSFFLDYFRFAAETTVAALLLSIGIARRGRFWLRLAAGIVGGTLVSLGLAALRSAIQPAASLAADAASYCILSILPFAVSLLVYRGRLWDRFFYLMNGAMLRMCARKLFDITMTLSMQASSYSGLLDRGQPLRYVIYYSLMAAVYLLAWLLLGRTYRKSQGFGGYGVAVIYLIILLINLALNRLEPVLAAAGVRYYIELMVCEAAYYALMLVLQKVLLRMMLNQKEAVMARTLWQKDRQQFEQMKENMESINIKCHDLRHQIREIRQNKDSTYLDRIADSISIYDSMIKTGNDALDVVLTEKKLRAEAAKIPLSVIADGGVIRRMDEVDIWSLFGNLLDNAIEYETGIEDPKKRFISLQIKEKLGYASIHLENYFEGSLRMEDGLPVTTKEDKTNHGFGMKSIRRIVEQYGGVLTISQEEGLFIVQILLPAGN